MSSILNVEWLPAHPPAQWVQNEYGLRWKTSSYVFTASIVEVSLNFYSIGARIVESLISKWEMHWSDQGQVAGNDYADSSEGKNTECTRSYLFWFKCSYTKKRILIA